MKDADEPQTLGELIPNLRTLDLDTAIACVSDYASVELGAPATPAELDALEKELGFALPGEYREFLGRHGSLKVVGDDGLAFGLLEVFGVDTILEARATFRSECDAWAGAAGWLDAPVESAAAAEARREELAEKLPLSDEELDGMRGDLLDELRVAYRWMVPVIQLSDAMHQGVDCIGPRGFYRVDIKRWEVDTGDPFGVRLRQTLGEVIAAPPTDR